MLCKFKLKHCCCWHWSNKSEEVSDDERKENIFSIEDEVKKQQEDLEDFDDKGKKFLIFENGNKVSAF